MSRYIIECLDNAEIDIGKDKGKFAMGVLVGEIICCHECEHWSKYRTDGNQSYCEILGGYSDGDKYCAWGERSRR